MRKASRSQREMGWKNAEAASEFMKQLANPGLAVGLPAQRLLRSHFVLWQVCGMPTAPRYVGFQR